MKHRESDDRSGQDYSLKPKPFFYEAQGRQPITWLILIVMVSITAWSIWKVEPWYATVGTGAMSCLAGWHVVRNPKWGISLSETECLTWYGRKKRTVSLSDIAWVRIYDWSDGENYDFQLTLNDGSTVGFEVGSLENRDKVKARFLQCGLDVRRL